MSYYSKHLSINAVKHDQPICEGRKAGDVVNGDAVQPL
jgi:hypothetical protein